MSEDREDAHHRPGGHSPSGHSPSGHRTSERLDTANQPYERTATLRLANGPLVGPVLCRVVSMVLARADCPMDRLDDALLICDTLCAHVPDYADNGYLVFTVNARPGELELRIGELPEQAAARLVGAAVLPGVGNVLEHMTDELRIEPAADGEREELVLGITF